MMTWSAGGAVSRISSGAPGADLTESGVRRRTSARSEEIPAVAGDVEEYHDPPVRLIAGLGDELDARGPHPVVMRLEVVHAQEQSDAAGELVAHAARLALAVGLGEQQPRARSRRAHDDPAFGAAADGGQGRRVLDQLEADGVDEEGDRGVVIVDDDREGLQMHRNPP